MIMKIIITADSPCDLPDEIIEENEIVITPLSILLDDKSFLDRVEISPDEIYDFVEKTKRLPKTAAVPPADYYELFKKLTDEGYGIVHIGLSSGISSSYHNACIASAEFENVYCVDSKSLCTAMGLLVLKACDLRNKGFDAKKIANRLTALVPKIQTTFVLDNLEYIYKGGRCSGVARFGANVLGIKPSIAVNPENGKLDVAKKYRGKIDAVYKQYIADCLKDADDADPARLVIANSGGVSNEIIAYAKGIAEGKGIFKEIITANAGCTISSHCGPKTLALFYIKK